MQEIKNIENVDTSLVLRQAKPLMETMVQFKELMMMYTCAIKEIRTKFDVLNTEFSVRYKRNPIQTITTRLKKTSGIIDKLDRKGLEFNTQNIERALNDIAGVRVICTYIDDIYSLANTFISQDDISLIKSKDYIAHPKPNGYRSLHLIVSVPVFFMEQTRTMKVEVQIRTIAMDFWASLEHQLKYKHDIPDEEAIIARLKSCADIISKTDREMLDIRKQIELAATDLSEEEELLERIKDFDAPIL